MSRWQSCMQFRGSCIVRISPGDKTASGRAALTGRQIRVSEAQSTCSEFVDVRRSNTRMSIAPEISIRDIIANNQYDIGPSRFSFPHGCLRRKGKGRCCNCGFAKEISSCCIAIDHKYFLSMASIMIDGLRRPEI